MLKSQGHTSTAQPAPQTTFNLTDDALVTFSPDGSGEFLDTGYMPVDMKTLMLGSNPLHVPGGLDGVFIQYTGTGVQTGANIAYDQLTYDLVGYKGNNVSFGAGGVMNGTAKQTFKLAHGSLESGSLVFTPPVFDQNGMPIAGPHIDGDVYVSVLLSGGQKVGDLDLGVHHNGFSQIVPLGSPAAPSGFSLSGGTVQATFFPV